ncbi:uncharacterized protein scaf1 [Synchiropus picturatus]
MYLAPTSSFRRRPPVSASPVSMKQITRSPPPCRSPSLSPSSPSSEPSSPLSTSSSVNTNPSQSHVKQSTGATRVSSTSASLAMTQPNASTESFRQSRVKCEDRESEIYDPFHPTDGDKEGKSDGIQDEGEKYDPFDPTGSPPSEDDAVVKEEEDKIEEMETYEAKEEEPPDSTDNFTEHRSPPAAEISIRRRVDCTMKARPRRDSADSENSEIEEGEIVGVLDRGGNKKRSTGDHFSLSSPTLTFFDSKPERILRVLDGDSFVSVCAEGTWEVEQGPEDEPLVGVEDLRRKLVSRRKERYLSFPRSSSHSPQQQQQQQQPPATHSVASPVSPPPPAEHSSKSHKSSKSSKDREGQKSKDRKTGEKEERRKKKRKEKDSERGKDKEQRHKNSKGSKSRRSSRSSSQKRKKRQHNSPDDSQSHQTSRRGGQSRRSSLSEERHKERERERDSGRDRRRDEDREKRGERDRDRGRDQHHNDSRGREQHKSDSRGRDQHHSESRARDQHHSESRARDQHHSDGHGRNHSESRRRDERYEGSRRVDRDRSHRRQSGSRERDMSKRSGRSRERRVDDRDRHHERERRRDGRPVVPPSIQDLNGSDLFAIKRTITVTTTTTTTTVPGSPRLGPASPGRTAQELDKPHKRKKKRKWRSGGDEDERRSCRSRSQSLSPPRYHSYDSDRYSEKLEIDMLSLDGEALDSDYPSLEDTPPAVLPPEPPIPSPKPKVTPKTGRARPKKKLKKSGQSESSSSSSNRTKIKALSSISASSDSAAVSSGVPSAKRARKVGKTKEWDKGVRKELGRTNKSKKEGGSSRKGKLQSKVSVLVREGVSSTTGASVGSGKLGMDLLGASAAGSGPGANVVGGSIAVVFCRDNESRSPFLKPCSEPLGVRSKDLSGMGKRNSLAAPPSSLTATAGLKSKKTKTSSITSTSSSASSPSSSLATKRRRRLAKKSRDKAGAPGLKVSDGGQSKTTAESWATGSLEASAVGDGSKSLSPHAGQAGPPPCSSSSSSSSFAGGLPPSSSPPRTPPPTMAPLRDNRDSSPDSQTVDSSCKTPEPSFLGEDCPSQTSPALPPSSPSSASLPQGAGLSIGLSTPTSKPSAPDDTPKSMASPPSSSVGCSLSLPLSSSDPSSSSVSSSSAGKPPPPPPPPPPAVPALPWSLQTGVDCTTGGVLALTALLFKMEEANIASRAKAQEFIQATSQILSQANQNQTQQHVAPPSTSSSSSSSQIPPPPSLPPPPGLSPAQFILHSSLPLVGCTKTPPSHLHPAMGGGCAQTPPPIVGVTGSSGDSGWDHESKDPDKYLKKLHTQERAVEEVKLAIKPYYQRKDINKDEYKDILRKAVHKICHSRTGEINPVKVSNLVKLYVQRYKYFRKHGRKMDEEDRDDREQGALHSSA